jgi:hypothetical protein
MRAGWDSNPRFAALEELSIGIVYCFHGTHISIVSGCMSVQQGGSLSGVLFRLYSQTCRSSDLPEGVMALPDAVTWNLSALRLYTHHRGQRCIKPLLRSTRKECSRMLMIVRVLVARPYATKEVPMKPCGGGGSPDLM